MKINEITSLEQLEAIDKASFNQPQLIYKHSTTCSLSESAWEELKQSDFEINYLDLLAYRAISNAIEAKYKILHESPQVLVIKDGVCIYNESHWRIKNDLIKKYI